MKLKSIAVFLLLIFVLVLSVGCKKTETEKNKELKSLVLQTVEGKSITLEPDFRASVTSYSALVNADVKEIRVVAEPDGKNAKIEGAGTHKLGEEAKLIIITVTAENSDKKEYIVNIQKRKNITVSGITLNITSAALKIGGQVTISAIVKMLPETATPPAVIYKSSNTSVAAVTTNGVITGISAGNAVITAKAGDKTAEVSVIVKKEEVVPIEEEYIDNSKYYNYNRNTFPLGGNIDHPNDYSRNNIFVDLVKTVENIGSADKPWEIINTVNEDGWPEDDFGIMLFRDQFNTKNGGVYKISFFCTTIPAISVTASSGIISNVLRDKITGKVTCDLTAPDQVQLFLSFRNTNGGIKNLKVLRPGYNEKQTFTKEYLDHMDRYSTIRTMDFTRTNGSSQVKWQNRQKTSDGPHRGKGVAWEYAVELANTLKADLWINVPHLADEEYIRSLATLIKNQLNPELNVYVEYSNETWNWMFAQTTYLLEIANKEPYYSKLNYDNIGNQYYIQWRALGEKLKESIDIFANVWGTDEINKRVRPVLASQVANITTIVEPMKYLEHQYGDTSKYIYGIAGAPYFSFASLSDPIQGDDSLTVEMILNGFAKAINEDIPIYNENMKNTAKTYGVKMLSYEGGPDTYAPGGKGLTARDLSQRDPKIKELIIKYLESWYYSGGELFNWYFAGASQWDSQFGSWGIINKIGEETGPKLEAIDAIIAGGMEKYAEGQIPNDNPLMDTNRLPLLINFESIQDTASTENMGTVLTEAGITFKANGGITVLLDDLYGEAYKSKVLHPSAWGQLKVAKADGKPFSIKSLRAIQPFNLGQALSVRIKGYMHTRGMVEMVVSIPKETGRDGVEIEFPESWVNTGMKEIIFEFMENQDGTGSLRFGALDDIVIYDKVQGTVSFTEEGPTNFKYMTKEVEVATSTTSGIQTHRFHFDTPDEYNSDKSKAFPLIISLYPWGYPNSEEALSIPEWTFGHLTDNSPYGTMPGDNLPSAFQYTPICPPPYSRETGGPNAPDGGEWNSPAAKQMIMSTIKELSERFNIDINRVYLHGFSMGGAGVWYIAQEFYDTFGIPVAGINRVAGYTPTNEMLDQNMFPDVYKSKIWYHVGEKDTMALNWDKMGNIDLAKYTYGKIKEQLGEGVETTTTRTIGNGLTDGTDSLEELMYEYAVGGVSKIRVSIYKDRGHEDLSIRNIDFPNWLFTGN